MDSSSTSLKVRYYLIFITSLLSFLATLSCIITYLLLKHLHTPGFKLIMGLSISNLLLAFSQLLTGFYLWASDTTSYDLLCSIQAALVNFSQLASFFWITALSWIMFLNIVVRSQHGVRRARVYYLLTFGFAGSFTIGPLIADQFQQVTPICWFKLDYQNLDILQFTLAMIEMYIPLWITIIGTFYATRRVILAIRANVPQAAAIAERLKYYPMILLVSWLFPTIKVIVSLILQRNIDWMEDASLVFHCSQGLFYSLLFFTTDSVRFSQRPRSASTVSPLTTSSRERVSTMDLTMETIKKIESIQ